MAIKFEEVSYEYAPNSPFAYLALKEVSVSFKVGAMTAIIGATGSGKSTLVQHLNALLIPTKGQVYVNDYVLKSEGKNEHLKQLRQNVGLVFQFPEAQLFEETIEKDIAFGPLNFGVDPEEVHRRVRESIAMVGLDESYLQQSPFELSGGQKRRVAIAGILAINPEILILDEPTAGLDPQGSQQMMALFGRLNKEYGKTILIVTHNMEQVLEYADEVIVMDQGELVSESDTLTFFENDQILKQLDIVPPHVIDFKQRLIEKGFHIQSSSLTLEAIIQDIKGDIHHE